MTCCSASNGADSGLTPGRENTFRERGDPLGQPLEGVKGLGPRRRALLAARGLRTVRDVLLFLPTGWRRWQQITDLSRVTAGDFITCQAEVVRAPRMKGRRGRWATVEMSVGDGKTSLACLWFNVHPAAFKGKFHRGQRLRLTGMVSVFQGKLQLTHPEVEFLGNVPSVADLPPSSLWPVYPQVEGISARWLRRLICQTVERHGSDWPDIVPTDACRRLGFPEASRLLSQIHFPPPESELRQLECWRTPAQRRLIFEELLVQQTGLALLREVRRRGRARTVQPLQQAGELARRLFGFELTPAQQRVLHQILADMSSGRPMNRLLQGEVGSGKTAVALLAALAVAGGGGQSALMAPTELLAEQHFQHVRAMMNRGEGKSLLRAALLTSAIRGLERRRRLEALARGEIDLMVGTHALLEPAVRFRRLDLCLIDEQQRFGVEQRARLHRKGQHPHLLVMTATPIPRTLALTLFGDLEVSILDGLPPGRRPVETWVLEEGQFAMALAEIRRRVAEGGQAYLVCPLVEESANSGLADVCRMFERLRLGELRGLRLGLLHGRMPSAEKQHVMRAFAAGELDVLVATTVVEVGLDVPNACLMVIEHAERFGLSQLHQLRGRVGRGPRPGTCILVCHGEPTSEARRRLQVMVSTSDGFRVAEEDLLLRGPGDFFGLRQSGLPPLRFADLARDEDLLHDARREAARLIAADPRLERPEHGSLKEAVRSAWGGGVTWAA